MQAVSVVITCFNLDRYIGAAIQSALGQDDAGDFEVIVVDDCSTDSSADHIRQFADVRYLRTERNSGVLNAMLAGVEVARGDIISLLDGDDLWRPGKLARTLDAFAQPGVAMVTHDLDCIDSEGKRMARKSLPRAVLGALEPSIRGENVRRGILELADYVWLGSALSFRRSAIDWAEFKAFAEGLPDPENTYQDWPLAFWIAVRPSAGIAYIDEPLLSYRLHGANYSGDARTVERAVRNFSRTRNSIAAIAQLADANNCPRWVRRTVGQRLHLAEAQVALYEGRQSAALRNYARALPSLVRQKILVREAVRLVIGAAFGPRRLAAIAAARTGNSETSQERSWKLQSVARE